MEKFIIIPVNLIPEWTKTNIKTYPLCRFSNSGNYIIVDDAHSDDLYLTWLNGDAEQYELIKQNAVYIERLDFRNLEKDETSDWFVGGEHVES